MKRILVALLSVFMVLCNMSVDAHAESIVEDESTSVDEIEEAIEDESSTPCGTLRLNGLLDGDVTESIEGYGMVDIYIDGQLQGSFNDYDCAWPLGTSYEIKGVHPEEGKEYCGCDGVLAGVIGEETSVQLSFNTIDLEMIGEPVKTEVFDGHMYLFFDTLSTWYAAKFVCELNDGHLVTITSVEENDFLNGFVSGSYWLGMTRINDVNEWITGEPFSYDVIVDDDTNEGYIHVLENDFATETYPFVCEIDTTSNPAIIDQPQMDEFDEEETDDPHDNLSYMDEDETNGIVEPKATLTIAQLRQKFPHGKYWNHANNPGSSSSVNNQDGYTSTPCVKSTHGDTIGTSNQTCNGFQPGGSQLSWQCMGYAEKLGYDSTGYNPRSNANGWSTTTSSSAIDNLKPGDIVRYTWKAGNSHSIFITNASGDTITFTDCNWSGPCQIRWNATISRATLKSQMNYVRVSPGISGGDNCNCTTDYAGDYRVVTDGYHLMIRSGHGTGYSKIGEMPDGAVCHVSKGNGTWAHVEYNGINGYSSLEYLSRIIPVSEVSLSQYSLTCEIDQTVQLTATVSPSNASDKTVTWSSSNSGVAMVSGSGLVTAVGSGDAVITANASGVTASCNVHVNEKAIPVYYLDVNFRFDGSRKNDDTNALTFDVYINGSLVANDVGDYFQEWPVGTNYEIKDIRPRSGYSYEGAEGESRSGTIGNDHSYVVLKVNTIDTNIKTKASKMEWFGGHTYLFFDPQTYYTAELICQCLGGHLVTIQKRV